MAQRDLGELGESALLGWSAQVGITANPVRRDRTGWDYILELPLESDARGAIRLPLDLATRPIQCLVQVKATDKQSGMWQVKLSNWIRLVRSPLPAFFLVLEYGGQNECQRGYLVHIGEKYIRAVLKRLRKLDPADEVKLHKNRMQFTYGEDDKLSSADGAGLLHALREHVGVQEDYVERKQELLRTVGYEDGRWDLRVVVPAPPSGVHPHEQLVDFTLGLLPSIEAKLVEIRDVRYGVLSSIPSEVFLPGTILKALSRKPVSHGTIVLTMEGGARQLRLHTDVYVPQGIGFEIEPRYLKIRFAAPFVDFISWPGQEGRLDLTYRLPDPNEEYDLREPQPVSELIRLLHDAGVQGERIDFEVRAGEFSGSGRIDVQGAFGREVIGYASALVHAWTISKHFDIQDLVRLRPIELEGQQEQLMLMAAVLGPPRPRFGLVLPSSEVGPSMGEKELCVPYGASALIGQYVVSLAWLIVGQPRISGETAEDTELLMETSDLRHYREYLCRRDEDPKYTLRDLVQSAAGECEGSGHVLVLDGVNSHLFD